MFNLKVIFLSSAAILNFNYLISMKKEIKIEQNLEDIQKKDLIELFNKVNINPETQQNFFENFNVNSFEKQFFASSMLVEILFLALLNGYINPHEYIQKYEAETFFLSYLHEAILKKDIIGIFALLIADLSLLNKVNSKGISVIENTIATDNFNLLVFMISLKNLHNRLLVKSVKSQNYEFCKLSLDMSANIEFTEANSYQKPLSIAFGSNNLEIIKLLISRGANLECLRNNMANYTLAFKIKKTFDFMNDIKKHKNSKIKFSDVILDLQDEIGNTLLHYAIQENNQQLIPKLLACKPNLITIKNHRDMNPVEIAAGWNQDMLKQLVSLATDSLTDTVSKDNCAIS